MRWLIILLTLSGYADSAMASDRSSTVTVINTGSFEQRLSEARKIGGKTWIGWAIQRWADPQLFGQTGRTRWNGNWNGHWQGRRNGSWNASFRHGQSQFNGRPLNLLVNTPQPGQPPVSRALNSDWEIRPLAILVAIHDGQVQQIMSSDFSLPVDLHAFPLHWLGKTTSDQSVAALEKLAESQDRFDLQQAITQAVGRHQGDRALGMLQRQLGAVHKRHPDIRRDAAEGLGFQQGPQVSDLLKHLILSDPHQVVRQAALEALRWQPAATTGQLLQDLASGSLENSVQARALKLLAQRQPETAGDTLDSVIWTAQDVRTAAAAAVAVGLLPPSIAMPLASRAATTHPEAHVRVGAVEAVAQLKGPESLSILREVVSNDDEYKVQETALEALVDLPHFEGLAAVAKVAHTHPNKRLRAEAIEALGDMGQEHLPARRALMTLIDV
ncbi:MAG: HEAT repeat domain-containing protein [Lysobacterales bacterium]